jgi:malate permease and related proteins
VLDQLIAIMAPVLISVGIGFVWARRKQAWDTGFITKLTYYVGTPLLVFSTMTRTGLDGAAFTEIAGAALLALAGFIVASIPLLWVLRLPLKTYLPGLIFPNSGNTGLPLCLFAFGEPGLALGIAYFTVTSISNFTLGQWISSGESSPVALLKTPLIYAVVIALIFMTSDMEVPLWLANTSSLVGSLTIPLILMTLGVSLANLKITRLGRATLLSVFRLGMGLAVGLGVAMLLGLEGTARGVVILDSAMPVAVFNYLFAQRYNNSPGDVAGMVVVSTALSFITLPALLLLII